MRNTHITYGPSGGDCTSKYYISLTKEMTVREFIDEWLEDKREWGYFGIYKMGAIFGNPCCEYKHGEITSDPLPEEYLSKKIVKVYGSGGWSRSDFEFVVEEKEENKPMQMRPFDVLCNLKNWTSWDYKAYKLSEDESKPCIKALENYIWHSVEKQGMPSEDGWYLFKCKHNGDEYFGSYYHSQRDPKHAITFMNDITHWRKIIDEE